MKRFVKFFIVAAVLLLTLWQTAAGSAAAQYAPQADALNQMHLFLGTGNGYELDRPPTRAEAAVMLIRLIGKEAEVQSGSFSHPFEDVPVWADRYVGYLYENGLTKGTSSTTFSAQINCTYQMYAVFMLRTLGYTEDNGDFSYPSALSFAQNVGLISRAEDSGAFLRDDMVAVSYSALFTLRHGSSEILLYKLISDGAVDPDSAGPLLARYEMYCSYLNDCASSQLDVSSKTHTHMDSEIMIADETMSINENRETTVVVDGEAVRMQEIYSIFDAYNTYSEATYYYEDGWLYIHSGSDWVKMPAQMTTDDYTAQVNIVPGPFYQITDIGKSAMADETVYSISYAPEAFGFVMHADTAGPGDLFDGGDFTVTGLTEQLVFKSGLLDTQTVTYSANGNITIDAVTYPVRITLVYKFTILDTGNDVTLVTPNNLDQYSEIAQAQ